MNFQVFCLPVCVLLLLTACDPEPVKVPEFDRENALALVKKLVAFGPRSSGTAANLRQAEFIAAAAKKYGAEVVRQEFDRFTELGKLKFCNIEATIPGERGNFVIIGCHFDTKKLPAGIEFEGANDGASGVAVSLEMIRTISASGTKPAYTLKFLFFDGEECISAYSRNDGLFGSGYYARKLQQDGLIKKCRAVIILDMVGDRDLKITIPADSDKQLRAMLLAAAARTGNAEYFTDFHSAVLDDHTPFQKLGIPAINIIDFEFGPGNSFWHTSEDNMNNLSPASLKITGQTVLNMIFSPDFL
ncbi:MAG: M28 family metallopeptidase [Victivallales bacterium]|nr:M28 family metallopeptidase [Victivallales bacterium]